MKYLQVFKAYWQFSLVYLESQKYARKFFRELKNVDNLEFKSLPKSQIEKIKVYIALSFICTDWAATLRNKKLSNQEKIFATHVGAATPVVDDLIDESLLSTTEIIEELPNSKNTSNPSFIILSYLQEKLLNINNTKFSATMKEALKAQDNSLSQLKNEALTKTQLDKLTFDKGAWSTALYRMVLDNPPIEGEKDAFLYLGYTLQQVNDFFDIYKDSQNNQQTLLTNSKNLYENKLHFEKCIQQLIFKFKALNYNAKHIHECLLKISIITSRGQVCLNQLLKLQGSITSKFDLKNYTRKQLICDMEKPNNVFESFLYSLKLASTIK